MRDYNTISAGDFIVESIEMKLRWLARRLRWTDIPEEIEKWATVVCSLNRIRLNFKLSEIDSPLQNLERGLIPFSQRKSLTISGPNRRDWDSNEIAMATRADKPKVPDHPNLKKTSPARWRSSPLPPCVEVEQQLCTVRKRTVRKGNQLLLPQNMQMFSMDIDTHPVQDATILDDYRETTTPEDNEGVFSSRALWRCMYTKLETAGKSYDYYDKHEFDKLILSIAEELGLNKDMLLRDEYRKALSKLKKRYFFPK